MDDREYGNTRGKLLFSSWKEIINHIRGRCLINYSETRERERENNITNKKKSEQKIYFLLINCFFSRWAISCVLTKLYPRNKVYYNKIQQLRHLHHKGRLRMNAWIRLSILTSINYHKIQRKKRCSSHLSNRKSQASKNMKKKQPYNRLESSG